mmetsp:Transcript_99/g.244  ORF Transcript_99/g.244 Transcript_99/m.244 type:complete len:209 (-) Transcript_99:333-959(-)
MRRQDEEPCGLEPRRTRSARFLVAGCAIFAAVIVLGVAVAEEKAAIRREPAPSELLLSPSASKKLKEAVAMAGKAPSSGERAKIQHMLMPIANQLAVRFLYTEVAERARANPTVPGHRAMEKVLASKKEMDMIEARVKNKLLNPHSGPSAEEVYSKIPHKYIKLLPALTTESAHSATTNAFAKLRQQMLEAEKNPNYMRHLPPADPNA